MSEMLTKDEARARVAKGAALLDQNHLWWAPCIDVGWLRMDDAEWCVLGQLCGDYEDDPRWLADMDVDDFDLGFHVVPMDDPRDGLTAEFDGDWQLLQDAWIEAIADRVVSKPEQRKEALCASVS